MLRFHAALLVLLIACGEGGSGDRTPRTTGLADASADETPVSHPPRTGEQVYQRYCLLCHGEDGRGTGPAAEFLFPRPRDFTSGSYKLRSTASGEYPTDDDLLQTVTRGIPGSAMPSFAFLPEGERRSVIEYVKDFNVVDMDGEIVNRFDLWPPGRIIQPGEPPERSDELLARGRELYITGGCWNCHGMSGIGDGPSSPTLMDSFGMPIRPANFVRGIFKGGAEPRDIYLRLVTGMTGTPMPSSEGTIPDERDRWALAHYVLSMSQAEQPVQYASHQPITARRVDSVGAPDPNAAYWADAPETTVGMMTTWQRMDAPDWVSVRVACDAQRVAVRLEWEDNEVDGVVLRAEDFTDGAAIQFGLATDPGQFAMGDRDQPVNIWQWRMDWQMDLARYQDVETRYPNMMVESYPGEIDSPVMDANRFPPRNEITAAPSHDSAFLSGTAAGNPMSNTRRTSAALNLTAQGFSTLETLGVDRQVIQARAIWSSGRWQVVFVRDRSAPQGEAQLGGRSAFVAFAVWDGAARDRDGQKSVTYWQELQLAP